MESVFFNETQLIYPLNNENTLISDIDDFLNFSWSTIDQSCNFDNYILNIYSDSNQLVYSNTFNQNIANISILDLEIVEGQVNNYLWNISANDNIVSDTFTFLLDATELNVSYQISDFTIKQNYPNPFNPLTCIEFEIFSSDFIEINIYDVEGNLIDNLAADYYNPGNHKIFWNAGSNSSGIYFYEVSNSNNFIRKKMIFIK